MPQLSVLAFIAFLGAAVLPGLAACSLAPPDPAYGPNAPHDPLGRPVDPLTGIPLPGTRACCGG